MNVYGIFRSWTQAMAWSEHGVGVRWREVEDEIGENRQGPG